MRERKTPNEEMWKKRNDTYAYAHRHALTHTHSFSLTHIDTHTHTHSLFLSQTNAAAAHKQNNVYFHAFTHIKVKSRVQREAIAEWDARQCLGQHVIVDRNSLKRG